MDREEGVSCSFGHALAWVTFTQACGGAKQKSFPKGAFPLLKCAFPAPDTAAILALKVLAGGVWRLLPEDAVGFLHRLPDLANENAACPVQLELHMSDE